MRKNRDLARRCVWFTEQLKAHAARTGDLPDSKTLSVWSNEQRYNEAQFRQNRWLNRLVALTVVLVYVLVVVVRG